MAILNTGSVSLVKNNRTLTGLMYADYSISTTNTTLVVSGTCYIQVKISGPKTGYYSGECKADRVILTTTLGTLTKSFSDYSNPIVDVEKIPKKQEVTQNYRFGTFSITVPKKTVAQTFSFTLSSRQLGVRFTDLQPQEKTISTGIARSVTITVPAFIQPTFDNDPMTFDTSFDAPYIGLTTASVYVKNLTAYDGAYISKVVLKIGDQTDELTGTATQVLSDGTLSILLGSVGTFIPTLTVTDSNGQFKTIALEKITVKGYTLPQVIINKLERTDANGVAGDEELCAVVTASITWTSAMADLIEPTIIAEEVGGLPVTITKEWYTDRALQNAISDWSTVTPSDMPVYCKLTNSNNPPNPFGLQNSYNITITPRDDEDSGVPVTATLGAAFYTMDFLAGGHGIAFGKPAETHDLFECDLNAQFNRQMYLGLNTVLSEVDEEIYNALVGLGWDRDVIIT